MARDGSRRVGSTRDPVAPWDDEELAQPPTPDWSRLLRWRRPILWVAVIALVAGGVWRLTDLDGAPSPKVASAPTTSASVRPGDLAGAGITVHRVAPVRDGSIFSDDGDGCPPSKSCRTSTALPSGVLGAVRSQYAHADVTAIRTIMLNTETGPQLWSRSVTARVGGRAVTVQVSSVGRELGSGRLGTGKDVLVYTEHRNGVYIVRVAVAGPAPRLGAVLRPADRLASDPRIVASS